MTTKSTQNKSTSQCKIQEQTTCKEHSLKPPAVGDAQKQHLVSVKKASTVMDQ